MSQTDPKALARELADAYAKRENIPAPSTRDAGFDLATAYAVRAEVEGIDLPALELGIGK